MTKKYKNIIFILIGFCIALIIQSISPDKINATDINNAKKYNYQKSQTTVTTDFIEASKKAINIARPPGNTNFLSAEIDGR